MAEQLLKMQGIEKRFSGVYALRHVDFTLNQGEVRGLIGENGAGKSTLMKVLGGDYQADAGKIYLNGQEIQIKDAETANQYGISFIHQELALFPELSIATNIFIQHLPSAHGVVKKREMHAKAAELLAEFGLAHCHRSRRWERCRSASSSWWRSCAAWQWIRRYWCWMSPLRP